MVSEVYGVDKKMKANGKIAQLLAMHETVGQYRLASRLPACPDRRQAVVNVQLCWTETEAGNTGQVFTDQYWSLCIT